MEYPKINSLYKRQFTETDTKTGEIRFLDKGKSGNPLIIGDYACPEFAAINRWTVTEKVDGTNIRIIYKDGNVTFGGRTENAQIPRNLLKYLQETFGDWNLHKQFPCSESLEKLLDPFSNDRAYPHVILFGEGYGPKIQSGGYYRKQPSFILFDVYVDGLWLSRENVDALGEEMYIDTVPMLSSNGKGDWIWNTKDIEDFVRQRPISEVTQVESHEMEGIIARSEPQMLFRDTKTPIMFKLKCRDFK